MSVSTEVQRTLVKSPPELWAELSSVEALSRHLGDLGEIQITALEPETKVEWEAPGASGVVQLKQSGWGTKVTLSVTRTSSTSDEPACAMDDGEEPVEPATIEPPVIEPTAIEPTAIEPGSHLHLEEEACMEAEPAPEELGHALLAETQPAPEQTAPRGIFARLFRRRRTTQATPVEAEREAEPIAPEPEIEIVALAAPEPSYPEPVVEAAPQACEPASDFAAELAAVEAQMERETTELLTCVLDRLGAAHHRPFSRG